MVAGGPKKSGSLRKVQLARNGQAVATVDLYDFFLNGDRSADARLQSGDTIHVPVVGSLVGVAGDVRRPAIYELADGESIKDVVSMAGGVSSTAYLKKVQVERVEAHRRKVILDLDLTPAEGLTVAPGFSLQDRDLITVSPISPADSVYVLLKGYVARPGRYQFVEGMRLRDLLVPYDNLLPNRFTGLAEILRLRPPLFRPGKLTVNLAKALDGEPEHNITLQSYDEVRLFSREEMEETSEVSISGAVLSPGRYRLYDNMTVRDLITSAGNLRRSAYLEEAELTRFIPAGRETRTEKYLVDLEKALRGDAEHNLPLQADDQLLVRAIPDFAEKHSVQLQGQVLFPGTYAIRRGESLSSVIERAGGFAPRAYLRGAVFTRESLKEAQKQRLDQLIFEQEQEVYRISAEIAAGAISKEDVSAVQSILESRKAMLEKLKQMPVTGRMVVNISPLKDFRGSDYDIELMNGDSITIPENPKSVSILGEVYNPTSLVYRPGKAVSYYLDQVGGPTLQANDDEMFIVRANGTVVSKAQGGVGLKWDRDQSRWIFGGFNSVELYPGDTVLVPQKVKTLDIMKEVKDITTIFYQMALGAAAVASF
jgi:protein involved in polysaccharide export with SLBB domain